MVWVAAAFAFVTLLKQGQQWHDYIFTGTPKVWGHVALGVTSLALLVLCLGAITGSDFNPFIYFRF